MMCHTFIFNAIHAMPYNPLVSLRYCTLDGQNQVKTLLRLSLQSSSMHNPSP